MGMDTSVRVARGMTRGRKGRGPRGAIGDTDSRSTSGPDPAAEDIRIVTVCDFLIAFAFAGCGQLCDLGDAGLFVTTFVSGVNACDDGSCANVLIVSIVGKLYICVTVIFLSFEGNFFLFVLPVGVISFPLIGFIAHCVDSC